MRQRVRHGEAANRRPDRDALLAGPRVDMPDAVPVPQKREFGRVF